MRKQVLFITIILIALLSSGCFGKKRSGYDGSYYGTDTPLQDFPLDSFYEPVGSDNLIIRDINFEYNSHVIKPESKTVLNGIIEWMNSNPNTHLLCEGHCDERGSNEYNLALGEQRALSVREYFVDSGIDAYRIQTISYGEEKPLDPGHDEGAWRQNRRVHFLISNG